MDKQLKSMAEKAIKDETPLKGYELGVMDAGLRAETGELVVILLDGRKMVYPPPGVNMKAKTPAPNMAPLKAPAATAKSSGTGSKSKKESKS